jgi:hypothetical protein
LRLSTGPTARLISAGPRLVATVAAALVAVLVALSLAGPARADTPPNQNDPCVTSGGRDSCGTTASGQYASYRFGTRWFGSYRGAVRGLDGAGYCIDLGFWYPGPNYGYAKRSIAGLHNRRGGAVSDQNVNRMAYALWTFGRTSTTDQASATMLYVHSLMGDAQPGELSPPLASSVASTEQMIAAQSAKFSGPYTIKSTIPSGAIPGNTVQASFALSRPPAPPCPASTGRSRCPARARAPPPRSAPTASTRSPSPRPAPAR